jgi:hypothetical protein
MTTTHEKRAHEVNARSNAAMTPKERRASDNIVARLAEQKRAALILNSAQAEAVYSAMCALNNVALCEGLSISFIGTINGNAERIKVEETDKDVIRVSYRLGREDEREHHEGQAAFATAYGLNAGA